MVANGIPIEKILIGKPVGRGDLMNTGFVEPNRIGELAK